MLNYIMHDLLTLVLFLGTAIGTTYLFSYLTGGD